MPILYTWLIHTQPPNLTALSGMSFYKVLAQKLSCYEGLLQSLQGT